MEGLVMGMFELCLCEALVVVDGAIADELNLGDAGNRLEIWMEDRLLRLARLVIPVTIALGLWIERLYSGSEGVQMTQLVEITDLCESILLLWSDDDVWEQESAVLIRCQSDSWSRDEQLTL